MAPPAGRQVRRRWRRVPKHADTERGGSMPHLGFSPDASSFQRLGPGLLLPEDVGAVGYKLALVANGATGGT